MRQTIKRRRTIAGRIAMIAALIVMASPGSALPPSPALVGAAQHSSDSPLLIPAAAVRCAPGAGGTLFNNHVTNIPGTCSARPRRTPGCRTVRYTDNKGVTRYDRRCKK